MENRRRADIEDREIDIMYTGRNRDILRERDRSRSQNTSRNQKIDRTRNRSANRNQEIDRTRNRNTSQAQDADRDRSQKKTVKKSTAKSKSGKGTARKTSDQNMRYAQRKERRRKRIRTRMRKQYVLSAVLLLFTLMVTVIANGIKKDSDFSATGNRMLTQKPEMGWKEIKDGSFMSDYESYVSDQFIGRDGWIRIKLFADRLLGKKESNGVYLGKDQYLMEMPSTPDQVNVERNLNAIQKFQQNHSDLRFFFAMIPNAAYVLTDYMPKDAPVRDQAKDIQQVKERLGDTVTFLDVMDTMKEHQGDGIYYKTDHHWTSRGAYEAFTAISTDLLIQNPASDYEIYPVTDEFSGTLASKSGYRKAKDTIEIYIPMGVTNDYVVYYPDQQKKTASLYDRESLNQKDQYEVFFGGNHALVDITTTCTEERCLLLLKDSYANSFVQFLTPYFREIVMIDPRYYYEDIEKVISSKGVTDVLFLYNANTFFEDNSLADVLVAEMEE